MKNTTLSITLSPEVRARLARQIAETNGLTVVCGGQVAAAQNRDQFFVG